MSESHDPYANAIDGRTSPIEHVHRHIPGEGSVTVEVERNSRGTNIRIKIDRPIRADAITTGIAIAFEISQIEAEVKRQLQEPEPVK